MQPLTQIRLINVSMPANTPPEEKKKLLREALLVDTQIKQTDKNIVLGAIINERESEDTKKFFKACQFKKFQSTHKSIFNTSTLNPNNLRNMIQTKQLWLHQEFMKDKYFRENYDKFKIKPTIKIKGFECFHQTETPTRSSCSVFEGDMKHSSLVAKPKISITEVSLFTYFDQIYAFLYKSKHT